MLARIDSTLSSLAQEIPPSGWCVALSGGADSVALIAALAELQRRYAHWRRLPLRAVHVHHGLRPAANEWARHCRALCRRLGVPIVVRRLRIERIAGLSLEAEARRLRYAALIKGLRRDEWLLAAHHVDDQLETMLLQWMRGAGVAGLAAMPERAAFGRGWLVRPLLRESRAELEEWLRTRELDWVEDDSNVDERFDRNYVRARILPLLRARWPAAAKVAARSAAHLGEARELLEELAALDLVRVMGDGARAAARSIEIEALASLSPARQRNVLRHWLRECGLAIPDAVHLERIRVELPAARTDAQPLVRWAGGEVRRFRGRLHALSGPVPVGPGSGASPPSRRRWDWRRHPEFALEGDRGVLRLVADAHGILDAASLPKTLWVGSREGGEKLVTSAGGPRRALKELLRSSAVPPWERERLPIVFADKADKSDSVIAVADLFVNAPYCARSTQTPSRGRFRLEWNGRFW